jgi:hypothetical protein
MDGDHHLSISQKYGGSSGFPTLKLFPQTPKYPIEISKDSKLEYYIETMNRYCNLNREKDGTRRDINELTQKFINSNKEERDIIINKIKELNNKEFEYYLKTMEKLNENFNFDFIKNEIKRINKILITLNSNKQKNIFKFKLLILNKFIS